MDSIAAFGDSVLKGVIYEDEHYRVSDASFQKICEEYFGITIENKDMGKTPVLLSLPPIDSKRYFEHISAGLNADNIMKWMRNDQQHIKNKEIVFN
jgi:hypothetical protein